MSASELAFAAIVGILVGFGSGALTSLVYACEDFFEKLPLHWMWWPALGAVVIGVGGMIEPRVLGVGYDTVHGLLRGDMIGLAVIGLVIVKAIVWSVALGSGTSGGVLAPLLIMGGGLGALAAQWIPAGDASLWAMTGMAAMMGGTMRSPLTATIFAVELTRDFNALPVALIGSVAALGVTVLLMRRSILTEKLARRGHHITREYAVDLFELVRVREVMDTDPPCVPATLTVSELSDRLIHNDPAVSRRQGTLIVDEQQRLAGIITRGDIVRALRHSERTDMAVTEAGCTKLIVTYPDEPLHVALSKMLKRNIGRLPVVDRNDPTRLLGYLGRTAILSARAKLHDEEHIRQKG